ncbi:MAG TPA: hypothetical protein VHI13_11715 [Candidatus Kapabacteria bacterium]|nr:hypothetical protein [Candidatus Kapabacteria bacterium]
MDDSDTDTSNGEFSSGGSGSVIDAAGSTARDIQRIYGGISASGILPGAQDAGVLVNPPNKRGQNADIAKPAPNIVGTSTGKDLGDYLPYILAVAAAGVVVWLVVK